MIALITGGSGMLGRALIRRLQAEGVEVRNFDLVPHPDHTVETILGDLRNLEGVKKAMLGVDTVFHTASVVSQELGEPQFVYDVNVIGTQNVIEACLENNVQRLIYTSSIDVIYDGTPLRNVDESVPYPTRHLDYYGKTKMLAEQAVIAANGKNGLATCSLRPASVYGPYDKYRFPQVLKSVWEQGEYTRIGDKQSINSHVYVDNVAHAHWLAAQTLTPTALQAGECYFITDHPAHNFFDFFVPFMEALEWSYKTRTIPASLAWFIAIILEWRYRMRPTQKYAQVLLTRYSVAATSRDFSYSYAKATRDFGYEPIVSQDEAFAATLDWLKNDWLPTLK